mmetsp:Transcript_26528/g.51944  ORF Transcript_26528/g.51944 Transcript_26528/m.51944 type:complete len:99 (-) Transcript_26528:1331-1627(-)
MEIVSKTSSAHELPKWKPTHTKVSYSIHSLPNTCPWVPRLCRAAFTSRYRNRHLGDVDVSNIPEYQFKDSGVKLCDLMHLGTEQLHLLDGVAFGCLHL